MEIDAFLASGHIFGESGRVEKLLCHQVTGYMTPTN